MKARAAILWEYQQPLSIEEVKIDSPKAGEVKVKIAAAGVCHSDYHVMKGEWKFGVPDPPRPRGVGHRRGGRPGRRPASSRATAARSRSGPGAGAAATASPAGRSSARATTADRVQMHDGTSRVHRNGEDIPVLGRMGGFAEYVVMPAQQVVPITADIDMESLALIGCAVTTGVGAVLNTAKVEPGSTVAVIGMRRRRAERGPGRRRRRREPDLRRRPAGQQAGLRRLVRRDGSGERLEGRRGRAGAAS